MLALAMLLWLPALVGFRLGSGWGKGLTAVVLLMTGGLFVTMPRSNSSAVGVSGHNWPGWSPFNLVPESDLVRAGLTVLFPAAKGKVILPELARLYAEMEQHPEYRAMPHVIHYTGADLVGWGNAAGHYYSYLPPGVKNPPLLVFLHGAMGNFQSFLYFWQKWAEPRGWAVICPTFGYGNWYRPGGGEAAEAALLDALQRLPVDRNRIVLTGLSNGGTGAVRLIRRQPGLISRLVLFSPVLEVEQFGSPEFLNWAAGHPPMKVLEGDQDGVVRPATVEQRLKRLRELGLDCDYRLLSGFDHYMMFTAHESVYAAMDEAMR